MKVILDIDKLLADGRITAEEYSRSRDSQLKTPARLPSIF